MTAMFSRLKALLLLLAMACCAPAASLSEVIDFAAEGFTVRNTVQVSATSDDAFRLATRKVGAWWHPDHTFSGDSSNLRIELEGDGCFCEKLEKGGEVRHLTVVHLEPGKLLRMTGGLGPLQGVAVNGVFSLSFEETDGTTEITLTYSVAGYRPGGLAEWAAPVDAVLALQLQRLERYINTGSPDDASTDAGE